MESRLFPVSGLVFGGWPDSGPSVVEVATAEVSQYSCGLSSCYEFKLRFFSGRLGVASANGERLMTPETLGYVNLIGIVAAIAFLWGLHRDVADLRERMARLEGLFDGFTKGEGKPA